MRMKRSVCEAFAFVLSEESTVSESNVVDFIARALAVETLPLLVRGVTLSVDKTMHQGVRKICQTKIPDNLLSAGSVHQQGDQRRRARAQTIVGQQGVLELVLAHHVF